ncbi:cupin domain-containing protein [Angustibacter sp. Root456]|uniref:cupin domain-containing protein n=1 Tax=Angustibacter sp. Root456 TaxID=1736539 RepID=UPI0009E79AA9|nr:cupin domain-containing protein [Angustibacter sp. Root456]
MNSSDRCRRQDTEVSDDRHSHSPPRPRGRDRPGHLGHGLALRAPAHRPRERRRARGLARHPAPGHRDPLHRHTHESEAFYLLEGTMTYRAGDDVHHLEAGSFIYLPKGIPHAFRVTGSTPVRFLGLTTPGALLALYDEVGVPATERRLPGTDGRPPAEEIGRWNEIGPRYGLQVVGPPIPEGA